MAQEVVILQGIGDPSQDAGDLVQELHVARSNILTLWNNSWDLKAAAYSQAVGAISRRDRTAYDHAKAQDAETIRWQKVAAEKMKDNDTLRMKLYGELQGKRQFTQSEKDWFYLPGGLGVPTKYNSAMGGTPIPKFPVFA